MDLTIVSQLNNIYFKEEWWQSHTETLAGITNYHQTMIDKGNIICYVDSGIVLGYCEFWRINFEQFGRLICHQPFIAPFENTTDGNLCYVANVWVQKEHRRGKVIKDLKERFFKLNSHCEFFVGEALRKKTKPIKVLTKKEFFGLHKE